MTTHHAQAPVTHHAYKVDEAAPRVGMKARALWAWLEKNDYFRRGGWDNKDKIPNPKHCAAGILERKDSIYTHDMRGELLRVTFRITTLGIVNIAQAIIADAQRTLAAEQTKPTPPGKVVRAENPAPTTGQTRRSPGASPATDFSVSCHTPKKL